MTRSLRKGVKSPDMPESDPRGPRVIFLDIGKPHGGE